MKKGALLAVLGLATLAANAQSIIDANDGRNFNDFYQKGLTAEKKAMPYPFERESDIVWTMVTWRIVDMNEAFNQFMYFPIETEDEGNTQGRVNLVHLIVTAAQKGEIEIFETDDLTAPLEWEKAHIMISGLPTTQTEQLIGEDGEPAYDEEGDPIEIEVVKENHFDLPAVKRIQFKEYWYVDKQDTRQKVRITALTFEVSTPDKTGEMVKDWAFWIPMDDMRVRQMLVNANAYDENNDVAEKTYDDIFIQRYFDSYVVRASNKWNREIAKYLSGEDAIYESRNIEDHIFNIESDMWEY